MYIDIDIYMYIDMYIHKYMYYWVGHQKQGPFHYEPQAFHHLNKTDPTAVWRSVPPASPVLAALTPMNMCVCVYIYIYCI